MRKRDNMTLILVLVCIAAIAFWAPRAHADTTALRHIYATHWAPEDADDNQMRAQFGTGMDLPNPLGSNLDLWGYSQVTTTSLTNDDEDAPIEADFESEVFVHQEIGTGFSLDVGAVNV